MSRKGETGPAPVLVKVDAVTRWIEITPLVAEAAPSAKPVTSPEDSLFANEEEEEVKTEVVPLFLWSRLCNPRFLSSSLVRLSVLSCVS